jgi:hypothetical protein
VTIENMDVFAQRPEMGLQRVTEVIALGEQNWANMRSGIAKQYTFWNNNNPFRCGGGTLTCVHKKSLLALLPAGIFC